MSSEALKGWLSRVLNHEYCDRVIASLIVLSVAFVFLEITSDNGLVWSLLGNAILWLFAVELAARFYASPTRWGFFRKYSIDLLSLAPLLGLGSAFTALRLLRLLRLGSILVRVHRGFGVMFRQMFGEQFFILTLIFVVVIGTALGLLAVEGHTEDFNTPWKTIWWSLFSMVAGEPIGEVPESFAGRLLTLVIMLGGLTMFALFTGTVSAVMAERLQHTGKAMLVNVEDLRDHVIICGWNRSGKGLVEELHHSPETRHLHIVIVAEIKPDLRPEHELDPRIFHLEGDYTSMALLKRAGVQHASRAILLADKSSVTRSDQDRDARTVLAALMIEKLNPKIFTCAELLSRQNEEHLIMAGIEEIVVADEYSANILAACTRVRGVTEIADEIFSAKFGNQFYKREVAAGWIGRRFIEVAQEVKTRHEGLLMAIERKTAMPGMERASANPLHERTFTNPPSDYLLEAGDKLIVLAKSEPRW